MHSLCRSSSVSVDGATFSIGVLVCNLVGGRCLDLACALYIRNLHGYTIHGGAIFNDSLFL